MKVNEVFGPTIQGEGPMAGRRAYFLRLAGCNLRCPWCDTEYAQDDNVDDLPVGDVIAALEKLAAHDPAAPPYRIVVTGGEPTLQMAEVLELTRRVSVPVDLETNGTQMPPPLGLFDTVCVSPKLYDFVGLDLAPLRAWARGLDTHFKFVVATPADVDRARVVVGAVGLPLKRAWLMPEGATRREQMLRLPVIADAAVHYGFNLSPRLHVLAWNTKKGV